MIFRAIVVLLVVVEHGIEILCMGMECLPIEYGNGILGMGVEFGMGIEDVTYSLGH